jgi:outer membrane lipoprotein-sorting protein
MQLDGGHSLGMVVSSKEQKYIRATIHNPDKTAGATIIYDGKVIALVEGETFQTTARILSGAEAAANLFDLIALNP